MDTFSTDITTARLIDQFIGDVNKYRRKPMSRSEAIRRLIMNGHEWYTNEKVLWSVSEEDYKEHTKKRREEYKLKVLHNQLDKQTVL